jgi:hypothetical protein
MKFELKSKMVTFLTGLSKSSDIVEFLSSSSISLFLEAVLEDAGCLDKYKPGICILSNLINNLKFIKLQP